MALDRDTDAPQADPVQPDTGQGTILLTAIQKTPAPANRAGTSPAEKKEDR